MRPGYSDLMVERIVLSDAEALAEFRTTIMGLKGLCTYGFGLEVIQEMVGVYLLC